MTQAIRLLRVFRQQYPDETAAEQWARMYAVVIPGYGEMNPVEQRDAQEHLRERVPWRRRQSSLTAQLGRDGKVRADETRRLARTQPARARVSFFFLRILGQRLHYTVMEHLSDHDLERYHLGMVVHEAELVPLEEHLLSCPECAARAEEVAEYVDTLRTAIIAGNFDFD